MFLLHFGSLGLRKEATHRPNRIALMFNTD